MERQKDFWPSPLRKSSTPYRFGWGLGKYLLSTNGPLKLSEPMQPLLYFVVDRHRHHGLESPMMKPVNMVHSATPFFIHHLKNVTNVTRLRFPSCGSACTKPVTSSCTTQASTAISTNKRRSSIANSFGARLGYQFLGAGGEAPKDGVEMLGRRNGMLEGCVIATMLMLFIAIMLFLSLLITSIVEITVASESRRLLLVLLL